MTRIDGQGTHARRFRLTEKRCAIHGGGMVQDRGQTPDNGVLFLKCPRKGCEVVAAYESSGQERLIKAFGVEV